MEKHNEITTAANSKTMNAVENSKLFAAAESEQTINFTDADSLQPNPDKSAKKAPGKKKRKIEKESSNT